MAGIAGRQRRRQRRPDHVRLHGPPAAHGPLEEFHRPDYRGGSILNLLSSIIRSRGGRSPHPELTALPAKSLAPARRVIYVLVDGLGAAQLERHLRQGQGRAFFAAHPRAVITSVFPATTAAAVTTFATGASPAEHAVLGWTINLPDLGIVGNVLLERTPTGTPLADPARLSKYLALPSHMDSVKGATAFLAEKRIVGSAHTRAGTRWQQHRAFDTLRGLQRAALSFARQPGRGVAYAYWGDYDHRCHSYGCAHEQVARHFDDLDGMLAGLARGLRGANAVLIVTADHGLVDVPARRRVLLTGVPGLPACLATLPSGDARAAACFVRPGREAAFKRIVRERLRRRCVLVPRQELLSAGLLGPGVPHRALEGRVGDYLLLARAGCAFESRVPWEPRTSKRAEHGGLSRSEMLVPLVVVGAAPARGHTQTGLHSAGQPGTIRSRPIRAVAAITGRGRRRE
jgi:hypothetical protein